MRSKTVIQIVYGKVQNREAAVLCALCCLTAVIKGSLLLINMISFLMKRNVLTSDPDVPTFRYTSILDFSDLYIAFSRPPGRFYFKEKETFLYRSYDWQTVSKKPWSNVLNALLDAGCIVSLTISFVEAAFFTGGDYFAEVTQFAPSSVICTPRFSAPVGDGEFFKSLMDLYHYNAPFNPSLVPFMHANWWKEVTDWGGFKRAEGGAYLLSDEAKPLGGRLFHTFAAALYSSRTRKAVIIDRCKGEYVRG